MGPQNDTIGLGVTAGHAVVKLWHGIIAASAAAGRQNRTSGYNTGYGGHLDDELAPTIYLGHFSLLASLKSENLDACNDFGVNYL
jgi:hypothetical protein